MVYEEHKGHMEGQGLDLLNPEFIRTQDRSLHDHQYPASTLRPCDAVYHSAVHNVITGEGFRTNEKAGWPPSVRRVYTITETNF